MGFFRLDWLLAPEMRWLCEGVHHDDLQWWAAPQELIIFSMVTFKRENTRAVEWYY